MAVESLLKANGLLTTVISYLVAVNKPIMFVSFCPKESSVCYTTNLSVIGCSVRIEVIPHGERSFHYNSIEPLYCQPMM